MKTDVAIIGSELDAYVAALRLEELGITSRIWGVVSGWHNLS